MRFKLKCLLCGATCWVDGTPDYPDSSGHCAGIEFDYDGPMEWEPEENGCDHADPTQRDVIDQADDQRFDDDVI